MQRHCESISTHRTGTWLALAMLLAAASPAAHATGWHTEAAPGDALTLPVDPDAAGADWVLGDGFEPVRDEVLDADVLEYAGGGSTWLATRAPVAGDYEIIAHVRALETGAGVVLSPGASGEGLNAGADYGLWARVGGERRWIVDTQGPRAEAYLADASLRHDSGARHESEAGGTIPHRWHMNDRFTDVSPLEDEAYRREIEAAISARPVATERWVKLRIVRRADALRMYADGMLVGEKRSANVPEGAAHLRVNRHVRIASVKVRQITAESDMAGFYPVSLAGRVNDRALGGAGPMALANDALPAAQSRVTVEGVPFRFASRLGMGDHVDLSHSLFRDRNRSGHFMANATWPGPQMYDPGRLMFNAPNRAYSRLWVIAAHDERPHHVPVVTVRFYRPGAGLSIDAAGEVPAFSASSAPGDAVPLPVTRADGGSANLWLVPIELDAAHIASELREQPLLSFELTKQVHPHRNYPDPSNYGWFQGGEPSGVRIFAMSLEEAPVHMIASGNRHGNVYVAPEKPVWMVSLANQRDRAVSGDVRLTVTDPYGEPAGTHEVPFALGAAQRAQLEIPLTPEVNGLHTVETEVIFDGDDADHARLARPGTFAQLPLDTRQATTDNSPWGIFSWSGGHGTHTVLEDDIYLLRAAGARYGPTTHTLDHEASQKWGILPQAQHIGNDQRAAQPWAFEDPYDPDKYAENRDQIGQRVAQRHVANPAIPTWSMFIETAITAHLTYGVPRRYIGEDPTWTEDENHRIRAHMIYGQAVTEGIREHAPDAKIALGWAGAAFTIPLLELGFPRELFDYIGVDEPLFERTPEMPVREVTGNRMWLLRQAMEEHGYEDVPIIHVESYYPSSNPLALGWRRSADHYVRIHALSLAMMPNTTFVGVFSLQDCSSYWGSQHYGEHGMISRQPEANPKSAYVAYATMTRLLDPGEYQGYVPTGSHSTYALHFTSNGRHVYPMWTIRGQREARIALPADAGAVMVDESGNEFPLEVNDGQASVTLSPTPLWITSDQPIEAVALGETDHSFVRTEDALMGPTFTDGTGVDYRPENKVAPREYAVVLDELDTPWTYVPGPYEPYAENHWATPRHDGPMRSEAVESDERGGAVWEIALEEPDVRRELTAWYGVFEPDEPIDIPGRARALGIWADGRSNWGRIVYELEDANGEIWRSIGTKDDWNCDDIHTWSYFNYDGWRYLEFPLPSHLPYDNYREQDTTWWGSENGDGTVQLPLKLRRIIIEHRTHNVYAEDLIEMDDRSVRLHRLKAIYDDAEAMTDAPIEQQRAMADLLERHWASEARALPNPIAELREAGVGEPTSFVSLRPPDDYDGLVTRLEVALAPIDGAQEYRIYVAAYENGDGARFIAQGSEPTLDVARLQPGFPLYLFATYVDDDGQESKPTDARRILLKDDFPFR